MVDNPRTRPSTNVDTPLDMAENTSPTVSLTGPNTAPNVLPANVDRVVHAVRNPSDILPQVSDRSMAMRVSIPEPIAPARFLAPSKAGPNMAESLADTVPDSSSHKVPATFEITPHALVASLTVWPHDVEAHVVMPAHTVEPSSETVDHALTADFVKPSQALSNPRLAKKLPTMFSGSRVWPMVSRSAFPDSAASAMMLRILCAWASSPMPSMLSVVSLSNAARPALADAVALSMLSDHSVALREIAPVAPTRPTMKPYTCTTPSKAELMPLAMPDRTLVAMVYNGLIIAPMVVLTLRKAEFILLACLSTSAGSKSMADLPIASVTAMTAIAANPPTTPFSATLRAATMAPPASALDIPLDAWPVLCAMLWPAFLADSPMRSDTWSQPFRILSRIPFVWASNPLLASSALDNPSE